MAATTGALFISYTIKTFGALIFATIMTTRQFLSILLSCLLFAHPLSMGQWAGTGIVFGTLYYQVVKGLGHALGAGSHPRNPPPLLRTLALFGGCSSCVLPVLVPVLLPVPAPGMLRCI